MQVVKSGKVTKGSMRTRIATILFHYRLTAQLTTGMAPSELLLGCRPQSHLDLLKPNTADRVKRQQAKQVQKHNIHARERSIGPGYLVWCRTIQERFHFESKCKMADCVDIIWIKCVAGLWKNLCRRFLICSLTFCPVCLLTHQLRSLSRLKRLVHQTKALMR